MKNTVVVAVVLLTWSLLGCGSEVQPAATEKMKAQAALNQLVDGFMKQDPSLLRNVLSKGQLESAIRAGPDLDAALLAEFASQRGGLIMNFGEEWLSKNEIRVSQVIPAGTTAASGASLVGFAVEINGTTSPKLVWFEVEGDDFKFAGIIKPTTLAENAVAAAGHSWPNWHFHNFANFQAADISDVYCGYYGLAWKGSLPRGADLSYVDCNTEYCGAGRMTDVQFVGVYPAGGHSLCMYNVIGVDAMVNSVGNFSCSAPWSC